MPDHVDSVDDVDVDTWEFQSQCPSCGTSAETECIDPVGPETWRCNVCDLTWSRTDYFELGDSTGGV